MVREVCSWNKDFVRTAVTDDDKNQEMPKKNEGKKVKEWTLRM